MQSSDDVAICDLKSVKIIRKSAILRNKDVTAYYKFIFNQCDKNKDGKISITELKEFLSDNEGEVPMQLVHSVHRCFDRDQNQTLDFDEFLDMINHPRIKETFQRIGSKYLKYVAESSVRRKDLKVTRTITNTGLYEEEIAFNQYTLGLIAISIVQIICFYVNESYDGVITKYTKFNPERRYEIWRYFTFVFDHANQWHLFGNVVLQLLIGLPLELVHTWRVPVIYLIGSAGGSLMHYTNSSTGLVGGSAGCYAFYSAHCATVLMNWSEMTHPIVALLIFGLLIAFDVIRNFIMHQHMMYIVSDISHLGGVLVGFPMGIIILRNLMVIKAEKIAWFISVAALGLLLSVLIVLNVVWDH